MPLHIIRRDITTMPTDAIVNTTNAEMIGYSGVDLLVHQKAGARLDALCRTMAPLQQGKAKLTPAFDLPCRYIIHTSGPVWQGGDNGEQAILESCYLESLKLAKRSRCQSVAFPLISSGAYGYPKDKVLKHAVQTISAYLRHEEMEVFLCVCDPTSYEFSRSLYADIFDFIYSNRETGVEDGFPLADSMPEPSAYTGRAVLQAPERMSMPHEAQRTVQPETLQAPMPMDSLQDYIKRMDAGFAETLFRLIDAKGMTDVACYKKANVDKKTFSKIKCNPAYRPSKPTVLAFAIALRLTLEETQHLLKTVGMALSHSSKFDLIVEYFIRKGSYDIYEINEALFEFDQMLLGC